MRSFTKAAVAAFVFAVPTAPAFAQALPDAKIAVVDSERIFRDCTACKAATAQLQTQRTQLQSLATQRGNELQPEAQQLQAAVNTAKGNPDAALQTRIRTFEQKQQAAQQQIGQQEQQVQRNIAYVREQIGTKLGPIITQVAQQRGATLAVDKGSSFYNAPATEITDAVLAALNAQLPSVSVTAPAQAAPTAPAAGARPAPAGR